MASCHNTSSIASHAQKTQGQKIFYKASLFVVNGQSQAILRIQLNIMYNIFYTLKKSCARNIEGNSSPPPFF